MEVITFEIAKKLKEKGFDGPCEMYYHIHDDIADCVGSLESTGGETNFVNSNNKYRCAAPTISQVLKWLREEKKIAINIEFIPYVWQYKILDMSFENRFEPCGLTLFSNYEEAAITGIEYTLDNLI